MVTQDAPSSFVLPDEFVFRSDEPRRLAAAAVRKELAGAGLALLATPLIVFSPSHVSTIAAAAAPVLAVAATAALVTRRPGLARHLLGASALMLLVAVLPALTTLPTADTGTSLPTFVLTVVVPLGLLVAAVLQAVRAERMRRLAWGIRKREHMDRDRELGRRPSEREDRDPVL
ncbi:MAG: hypothetical protein ACRDUY_14030 [Nitriliruptorales bacterium]